MLTDLHGKEVRLDKGQREEMVLVCRFEEGKTLIRGHLGTDQEMWLPQPMQSFQGPQTGGCLALKIFFIGQPGLEDASINPLR